MPRIVPNIWLDTESEEAAAVYTSIFPRSRVIPVTRYGEVGPREAGWLTFAFILYGVGLNGLVTSLGGLFAVDIAPKRVAGAVMGVVGIFSYIGAAMQEHASGWLIERSLDQRLLPF